MGLFRSVSDGPPKPPDPEAVRIREVGTALIGAALGMQRDLDHYACPWHFGDTQEKQLAGIKRLREVAKKFSDRIDAAETWLKAKR